MQKVCESAFARSGVCMKTMFEYVCNRSDFRSNELELGSFGRENRGNLGTPITGSDMFHRFYCNTCRYTRILMNIRSAIYYHININFVNSHFPIAYIIQREISF